MKLFLGKWRRHQASQIFFVRAAAEQSESAPDPTESHQLRAKEYRERYEGMRNLEWQTLLQTYAGYAAIGVAFEKASERFVDCHSALVLRCVAMTATLIFFVAMYYMHYRIEERLIVFDETYESYMQKLRGQQESQHPGTHTLGHQFFWTYDTQLILSAITALGILAYERFLPIAACDARSSPPLIIMTTAVLFGYLGAIAGWTHGRIKLRALLTDLRACRNTNEGRAQ